MRIGSAVLLEKILLILTLSRACHSLSEGDGPKTQESLCEPCLRLTVHTRGFVRRDSFAFADGDHAQKR